MKTFTSSVLSFAALLLALTLSPAAFAEEADAYDAAVETDVDVYDPQAPQDGISLRQRNNRVAISPLHVPFGNIPIEYERAFSDRISLAVSPSLITPGVLLVFGYVPFGVQLTTQLRYYFSPKQRLHGFWAGPELFAKASATNTSGMIIGAGAGAMAGYTFIMKNGVSFSGGLGGGLGLGLRESGLAPLLRIGVNLNVGYAF